MFLSKKSVTFAVSALAMLCSGAAFAKEAPQAHKAVELSILHINDHHSYLEPHEARINLNGQQTKVDIGGFSAVNGKLYELRKKYKNPLVLHAGDAITGTLYFTLFGGSADAAVMNAGNFHYFTLGNHEFDAGMTKLAQLIKNSTADFISSNYDVSHTPLHGTLQPWVIKKVGKYKIGFLALNVNPDNLVPSESCKGVIFHDPIQAANETAALLKQKGADIVVAVSHLGYTAQDKKDVTDPQIAAASSDIDIIIGGHSHTVINPDSIDNNPLSTLQYQVKNKDGKNVLIAQTGMSGAYLGCITIEPRN